MKVNEAIDVFTEIRDKGFGDSDICIMFHNTAHQIEHIDIPNDDVHVAVLYREYKPSYFLTSTHKWVPAR